MKTKHFLLLALAFIIAIPNYAQKPKKTKIGDIVINCCVNKETGEMYGSGTLKIVPILSPEIKFSFEDIKQVIISDNEVAYSLSSAKAELKNMTIYGDIMVH